MGKKIRVKNLYTPAAAATETLLTTIADVNGCVSLPIHVGQVLSRMGLKAETMYLDSNISGLLVKDKPGEPFKAVSNVMSYQYQKRFTYAHELGHYVHTYQDLPDDHILGMTEKNTELSSLGSNPEEIWANKYAEALLMPASIVRDYWAQGLSLLAMLYFSYVRIAAIMMFVAKCSL